MSEEKKEVKKVEPKKAEEIKKDFEKVNNTTTTKKKKDPTGRGISIKNWIFIIIAVFIAFGAGYYFSFVNSQVKLDSCQTKINQYQKQIETLQEKQEIIQNIISK